MELVVNRCYGGFGLSAAAIRRYAELCGFDVFPYTYDRNNMNKTIRSAGTTDDDIITFWLKEDIGDNPTDKEINDAEWVGERDIPRNDKNLIQVVRELGDKANSQYSKLDIVDIPDDVKWEISEYDGMESVEEAHRSW